MFDTYKMIARRRLRSLGEVMSDLARRALRRPKPKGSRNGIPLLPPKGSGKLVTLDVVSALSDEAP